MCLLFLISQSYWFLPNLSSESENICGDEGNSEEDIKTRPRYSCPEHLDRKMEPPPAPSVYLQVACCILPSLQWCLNADFIYMKISLDGGRDAPILPNLHSPTCPWITCNDTGGISMETDVSFSQMFSVATRSGSFVCYVTPQEAFLSYLREFIFIHRT